MARLLFCMFLLSMHCVLMHCSMQMMRVEYKPYGLQMCLEMCAHSGGLFTFSDKELSCRLLQTNESGNMEFNSTQVKCKKKDVCGCLTIKAKDVGTSDSPTMTETKLICGFKCGCKFLHKACEKGNLQKVRDILIHHPDLINCRGAYGRTPVMSAAYEGQTNVFDFLVNQGANLSAVNHLANDVLYTACRSGNIYIIRKLVEDLNMDIHKRCFRKRTPLMNAARHCHKNVFDFLVIKGSDIHVKDNYNDTVLHVICMNGCVELLMDLLSKKLFDIDRAGYNGFTPIMAAADQGNLEVVKILMDEGCKINPVGVEENNILHIACGAGHTDVVKYILSQNLIDINSRNFVGRTPLMKAAGFGQREVFDLLLTKGSNPNAVDAQNNTLLHIACMGGSVEMVSYILSRNIFGIESRGFDGRTPVMTTVEKGQVEVFDFLRHQGCNLTAVDEAKNNIIHHACRGGHVDMLKAILSLGVVDVNAINQYGETPVMIAELNKRRTLVSFLKRNA